MTTKKTEPKDAAPVHSLVGEGGMNPAAMAAMVDAAAANRPFGLTAANPGGIANGSKLILMDYLFGATAPATAAATYYVGLVTGTYTGGTSDIALLQGTFTATPEVTTGAWTSYARVAMTNNTTNWNTATAVAGTQVVTKSNATIINFTSNAAVTGTGPTPTGWFVCTVATGAPTAAQMIATGNLTSGSVAVVNGTAVSFAAGAPGALTITLT